MNAAAKNDSDVITWKQVGAIISIVSLVQAIVLGLGFRLFYSAQNASALEVRVSTVERDISQMRSDISYSAQAQQQILANQRVIIDTLTKGKNEGR